MSVPLSQIFHLLALMETAFTVLPWAWIPLLIWQGVEKQGSGRQARRATIRQAQHIQAYVSIGESPATLNGGLRRSFSRPC